MRVMIDTNLLISSVLLPSGKIAHDIFNAADKYSLVISTQIIEEFRAVVKRKFPDKADETEILLRRLRYEIAYTPENIDPEIFPKIRDPKDYPILALAILAGVDVFISGDMDFNDVVSVYLLKERGVI
jgi:putative PIN family toxin of toxin-antitoxin system